MKKFSIGNKILVGFLLLIIIFAVNAGATLLTSNQSSRIIERNSEVINPSTEAISDFTLLVTRSKMLITNWVYLQNNDADKAALRELHEFEYPELKSHLEKLMTEWENEAQKDSMNAIFNSFDSLLVIEQGIMQSLTSFEDYEDPIVSFESEEAIDYKVLPISSELIQKLENISKVKQEEALKADVKLEDSFKKLRNISLTLGIIIIALGLIAAFVMARNITRPINYVKAIIQALGRGELPEETSDKFSKDEIGEMAEAVQNLVKGLRRTSHFAEAIGQGNYQADFEPLSENDVLGNALIEMRDNLQKVAEEDKRRNWATEGQAKFGEILRQNNDNLEKLSDEIISNLIKYVKGNQGGLYIIHDNESDDRFMTLSACYAWDKKKYLEQKIYEGDGLVGQSWLEQDTIYLTEVPSNYVNITSGLGEANPNAVLIVPLKVNDAIFGVIEIASFYQFEKHQVEFIEKIAESIASTISSVKINERTQRLLEESTEMTEQMRAQEEEMRQNMEELQATQEEMQRAQRDNENKQRIINDTSLVFEMNEQLEIISINDKVKDVLGFDYSALRNQKLAAFIANDLNVQELAQQIDEATPWAGVMHLKDVENATKVFNVSMGKVISPEDHSTRIVILASDITAITNLV